MHYTIIGLRETGELSSYGRSEPLPSLVEVGKICHNFGYVQVLVLENKMGGYAQRYEYDIKPRAREVPMRK